MDTIVNEPFTAEEAVQNGASLLDNLVPGWERSINTDYLDISSACSCVLGQLYRHEYSWDDGNGYNHAHNNVFDDNVRERMNRYGFTNSGYYSFPELDEAWVQLIDARRN